MSLKRDMKILTVYMCLFLLVLAAILYFKIVNAEIPRLLTIDEPQETITATPLTQNDMEIHQ